MKSLRILGDSARLRILRLLDREELSVADLQEVLGMGQSRISMQLSQLRAGGFVEVRKLGQKSLYHVTPRAASQTLIRESLDRATLEMPETTQDDLGLALILKRRKDHLQGYFDSLAGKFGRNYVPGRSWKALAESLLKLLPPLVIADLGAGEGTLALMMAQSAEKVIAVDSSRKMVEYGAALVERSGIKNLEYRLGDMEDLPVESKSVDLVLIHQALHHALHPSTALTEACRILRPAGRVVVLDLLRHDFEAVRDLYADVWLGFAQAELIEMLSSAGFEQVDITVVDRAEEPPHFETVLATARKPVLTVDESDLFYSK